MVKFYMLDVYVGYDFFNDFEIGRLFVEGLQVAGERLDVGFWFQFDQGFFKDMIELLIGKEYWKYQSQ